jgi:hypothetical protein
MYNIENYMKRTYGPGRPNFSLKTDDIEGEAFFLHGKGFLRLQAEYLQTFENVSLQQQPSNGCQV